MRSEEISNKPLIQIEYIHDVVCSWCPIGLRHLDRAMALLEDRITFDLKFLPYELNPDMPEGGEPIEAYFKRRNGWSSARFAEYAEMVVDTAASVDLVYDYARRTHYYNTSRAHRLIDLAEQSGLQKRAVDTLTETYFRDGVDIADISSLVVLGEAIGLDPVAVREVVSKTDRSHALQAKYEKVQGLEISSIPTMLINGRTLIRGSNSAEYFYQAFQDIVRSEAALPVRTAG